MLDHRSRLDPIIRSAVIPDTCLQPTPSVYGFHRGNFRSRKNVRVATTFYLNWMGNGKESVERLVSREKQKDKTGRRGRKRNAWMKCKKERGRKKAGGCRHRSRGNDFRVDFVRLALQLGISCVSMNASFNIEHHALQALEEKWIYVCRRLEAECEIRYTGVLINVESETHPTDSHIARAE